MTSSKLTIADNTVVSLIAPTASGKTALAYQLYDTGRYELVSVDSALIYRDMNIGTAKPTIQELEKYPHHLVNIISPTESYNVANFVADVDSLIDDIHNRGKIPLLVGGTMMYYMALFEGISNVPSTEDAVREQVEAWRQQDGIESLYSYLSEHDAVTAGRLESTDTQRITRAVEVLQQTGQPISYWQSLPKQALANKSNQSWLGMCVMPDRGWLHDRIALRLQMMWEEGLVEEVIGLITQYSLSPSMPSMRCVGYRQVVDFLLQEEFVRLEQGVLKTNYNINTFDTKEWHQIAGIASVESCEEMKNKALYATRQLAKRQYTWLRKLTSMNNSTKNQLKNESAKSTMLSFDSIQQVKQLLI